MSSSLFNLHGKTALITGAAQGIGYAIASGLLAAGATVILHGRDKDKLDRAAATLNDTLIKRPPSADRAGKTPAAASDDSLPAGTTAERVFEPAERLDTQPESAENRVRTLLFDITNSAAVGKAIAEAEDAIGPIDILVNNAGIIRRAPAAELTDGHWADVISTNLTAVFYLSREVGRRMCARKSGKIINICSLMSEIGREQVSAYAASKGGLKMLTRNLAAEWGEHNVQVNGIGPGYIATPINAVYREPGNPLNEYIVGRTPAGRWGKPEDLAGTAVFLSSAASDFVNGQIIYVDGGLLSSFGKPPAPTLNQ